MLQPVVYPPKSLKANVGKRIRHRSTGYWFEKSKNGKWGLVWTDELIEAVRKLYVEDEKTLREIAETMDVTHSLIQKLIDANNWMRSKRERGEYIKSVLSQHKKLKKMYITKGMSAGEIAAHFKIDPSYLELYFKEQPYRRTMSEAMLNSIERGNKDYIMNPHFEAWDFYLTLDLTNLDFLQYKHAARKFTNCVMLRYGHIIDPKCKRSHDFHVDHRVSISEGFYKIDPDSGKPIRRKKVLPLYELCHPANLKLMRGKDNHIKSARSSISVKKLQEEIHKFDTMFGVVF